MNWKQQLAEWYGYKNFEYFDSNEQILSEKAVELYQKELNEKLKNVGLSVSELSENERRKEKDKTSWDEWYSNFIQKAFNG